MFGWQSDPRKLITYVDSDWAGGRVRLKSTSGGMVFRGRYLIKAWSTDQQVSALSSGEAGLNALTKGAAQTRGIVSLARGMGGEGKCGCAQQQFGFAGHVPEVGLGERCVI